MITIDVIQQLVETGVALARAERERNEAHVRLAGVLLVCDIAEKIGHDQVPIASIRAVVVEKVEGERVCRGCGCTDDRACPGGCWWHDLDPKGEHSGPLCSRCVELLQAADVREGRNR